MRVINATLDIPSYAPRDAGLAKTLMQIFPPVQTNFIERILLSLFKQGEKAAPQIKIGAVVSDFEDEDLGTVIPITNPLINTFADINIYIEKIKDLSLSIKKFCDKLAKLEKEISSTLSRFDEVYKEILSQNQSLREVIHAELKRVTKTRQQIADELFGQKKSKSLYHAFRALKEEANALRKIYKDSFLEPATREEMAKLILLLEQEIIKENQHSDINAFSQTKEKVAKFVAEFLSEKEPLSTVRVLADVEYKVLAPINRGTFKTVEKVESAKEHALKKKELALATSKLGPSDIESASEEGKFLLQVQGDSDFLQVSKITYQMQDGFLQQTLLLELCQGDLDSLPQFLKEHPEYDTLKNRQRITEGILRGLYKLHNNYHVIHRDVKGANFLFAVDGKEISIRLSDFGTKCAKGDTEINGSPCYFAPEYLEKAREGSKELRDAAAALLNETATQETLNKARPQFETKLNKVQSEIGSVTTPKLDVYAAGLVLYKLHLGFANHPALQAPKEPKPANSKQAEALESDVTAGGLNSDTVVLSDTVVASDEAPGEEAADSGTVIASDEADVSEDSEGSGPNKEHNTHPLALFSKYQSQAEYFNFSIPPNWFPEPSEKLSIEYLIWSMLRDDPNQRLSSAEALAQFTRFCIPA